jgi:hypothetical protein
MYLRKLPGKKEITAVCATREQNMGKGEEKERKLSVLSETRVFMD